jgi:hypothetical protein
MVYENVYWDASWRQESGRFPSILAIGDSWFWYPFPGGSLLNQLGPLTAAREHVLYAVGNNGAEVYDYVHGKYSKSVRTALNQLGSGLSAVFVSGGGNDFAGFNDLRPLLKEDCSAETTAEGCYRGGGATGTIGWLMRKTKENYELLLGQIFMAVPSFATVFLHNYDYALPSGKGVFGKDGAWLKPALDDAAVRAGLQSPCMEYLIDRFTAHVLEPLAAQDPDRIIVVDSRDTLDESDWANELHPKPRGFERIAKECWYPELWAQGLAS